MGSDLLRNLRRPGYPAVISDKVLSRATELGHRLAHRSDPQEWASGASRPAEDLMDALDAPLRKQSEEFARALELRGRHIMADLGLPMGGGGHYALLYFLTRFTRPAVVVETGVAAGWSSAAVLRALDDVGSGELHSSDFPYFRLPDPERLVGILVEQSLRTRWHVHLRGDRLNLPSIMSVIDRIDLFHYDSDKSVRGRARALKLAVPMLSPSAIVVIDDVQDNHHFRSLVNDLEWDFWITSFSGKYLGVTGPGFSSLVRRAEVDR